MDEDRFNMSVRNFLKQVGVTSQRVIEEAVRSGKVEGNVLEVKRPSRRREAARAGMDSALI